MTKKISSRHKNRKSIGGNILSSIFIALMVSCGVYVGNPDEDQEEESTNAKMINGSVILSAVQNATVTIYKLSATGVREERIVSGLTNERGEYTLSLTYTGAVELVATKGNYTDEATGVKVTRGDSSELRTVLAEIPDHHIGINALTEIATSRIKKIAAGELKDKIASTNHEVAQLFGLYDVDFVAIKPHDLTDPDEVIDEKSSESRLGLVMAGFSQVVVDNGLEPESLGKMIENMAEDYSDGQFDGKRDNEVLSNGWPISAEDVINGFHGSMENFLDGPRNAARFSKEKMTSTPASDEKQAGNHL